MAATPAPKPADFVVSGGANAEAADGDYRAAASQAREPLVIQWRRRGGSGVELMLVVGFVGAGAFPRYAGFPRSWVLVAGLFATASVLAFGLRLLKSLINRTTVSIDDEHLRCEQRPIRIFERSAQFDSKRVRNVWVHEVRGDVARGEGYESEVLHHDVQVSYESGQGTGTLLRLSDSEGAEARFLAEAINHHLGLVD